MMKRLLLTSFLSVCALFAASAQVTAISLDKTSINRDNEETVTATITYTAATSSEMNIFFGVESAGGVFQWADGTTAWTSKTVPAGTNATTTVTLTSEAGTPLSADIAPKINVVAARVQGGNPETTTEIEVTGTTIVADFVSLTVDPNTDVPQLSTIDVDIEYNTDTEVEFEAFVVEKDGAGEYNYDIASGVASTSYAEGVLEVSATTTTKTIQMSIAEDFPVTPTAGSEYVILVRFAGMQLDAPITFVESTVSATLSNFTTDASAEQGGSASMSVDYVAEGGSESFSIDFGIIPYNTSTMEYDYTVGAEDFSAAVTGNAATASATTVTGSLTIKPGQMTSTELAGVDANLVYKAVARIYEDGTPSTIIDLINDDITINAASGTLYNVEITSAPSTATVGDEITIGFDYTAPAATFIKVSLDVYEEDGFTVSETIVANDGEEDYVAADPGPTSETVNITIPYGTTYSSSDLASLNSGYTYKITVTIFEDDGNGTLGAEDIAKALPTSDITIGYVAGLNEVDESGMTVHPNPATNVLYVNAQGTVIISDMTGQTVKTVNASNAIDVSDLEEGVYILTTESGQTNKFVKK